MPGGRKLRHEEQQQERDNPPRLVTPFRFDRRCFRQVPNRDDNKQPAESNCRQEFKFGQESKPEQCRRHDAQRNPPHLTPQTKTPDRTHSKEGDQGKDNRTFDETLKAILGKRVPESFERDIGFPAPIERLVETIHNGSP